MLNSIVAENGYYKAANALNNLHESDLLDEALFRDGLDQLFSMFVHEYMGNTGAVEKFQKHLDNLSRGL